MAYRAGGGPRSVAPSLVGAAVLGTALTYHSGPYSPQPPLSRTTTNGRTFGAQFARILMWPPSVLRAGDLNWRGAQPPRDLYGKWGSQGEERGAAG